MDLSDYQKAAQLEAKGNYAESKTLYRKFYERYPKNRMAQFAMYREGFLTQVHMKKFEEGKQILNELIKKKPDAEIRSEAFFGIGIGYHVQGKTQERNNILKMLINEFPGSTASESAKLCLEEINMGMNGCSLNWKKCLIKELQHPMRLEIFLDNTLSTFMKFNLSRMYFKMVRLAGYT